MTMLSIQYQDKKTGKWEEDSQCDDTDLATLRRVWEIIKENYSEFGEAHWRVQEVKKEK